MFVGRSFCPAGDEVLIQVSHLFLLPVERRINARQIPNSCYRLKIWRKVANKKLYTVVRHFTNILRLLAERCRVALCVFTPCDSYLPLQTLLKHLRILMEPDRGLNITLQVLICLYGICVVRNANRRLTDYPASPFNIDLAVTYSTWTDADFSPWNSQFISRVPVCVIGRSVAWAGVSPSFYGFTSQDPDIDGRIILRWIFRKWDVRGKDWIVRAQNRDRWRAFVIAVMNLWVP